MAFRSRPQLHDDTSSAEKQSSSESRTSTPETGSSSQDDIVSSISSSVSSSRVSVVDSLPEISKQGATVSEVLRAARRAQKNYAQVHEIRPPGAAKGGLEQETPLVYSWKRTRAIIAAMGIQRKLAHSDLIKKKEQENMNKNIKTGAEERNAFREKKGFQKGYNISDSSDNMVIDKHVSKKRHPENENEDRKEDEEESGEKSHVLQVSIPHGFQLIRTLTQPKPLVKSVLNTSANNADSFAILDSYYAQMVRGARKVASISVGDEKGVPSSHLSGLSRWIFIEKYRLTIIATLHLELKVLGLSLEALSQTSSVKPVCSFAYHTENEEVIAGGVGNIRIWTLAQAKGTFRLIGPRLIIEDLATEEWINHVVVNQYLNRLIAACDCDILVYDYISGRRIDRFREVHGLTISAMIFYPPQQYLITASKDATIKVWTRYTLFILELKCQTRSPVTGLAIVNPDNTESLRHTLLLSAYQDGIIRMWNLENGNCVYKHQTYHECLGLGWLRSDTFYNFSRDRISIWNLNRKYIPFSTITSPVTSINRVDIYGYPPRLLTVADDASVKLLSPVTGATLLTAFPAIRDSVVSSVEYDTVSNMLWVLTTNGDVFVYSTLLNPCKVIDEWRVQVHRDAVTCMTSFRTAPKNGKRSLTNFKIPAIYTLFGGTDAGQIVTMDIRKLNGEINTLCQAHSSKISTITCNSEKMQLATASFDGNIKLWLISWTSKMDTTGKDDENPDLCLQILPYSTVASTCVIKMPKGYATIACLNSGSETAAFSSNTCNLAIYHWNYRGFSETRRKHAADEDHLKSITSLTQLSSLKIFATSSEDGTAKIWDAEANSIVREIQFNERVSSVGFCNPKGDLLVGLTTQIVLVRVHDYLPSEYLADLIVKPDGWLDDPIESPKVFDSDLDFWELYRIGLEKIGADLSKWHVKFRKRNPDEDLVTAQINELERKKHDIEEQRKRTFRQERKRRRQLRNMTILEQRQLLEDLGLLDSLKAIDIVDLMRNRKNIEIRTNFSALDAYLDNKINQEKKEKELRIKELKNSITSPPEKVKQRKPTLKNIYDNYFKGKALKKPQTDFSAVKIINTKQTRAESPIKQPSQSENLQPRKSSISKISPTELETAVNATKTARLTLVMRKPTETPNQAKKLFPGKSKQWVQNNLMKFGLLPNSIIASTIEEDGARLARENAAREAEAVKARQNSNTQAMMQRARGIKRPKLITQNILYQSENNKYYGDFDEEEEDLLNNAVVPASNSLIGEVATIVDLEETERLRKLAEDAERLSRLAEQEELQRKQMEVDREIAERRARNVAEFKDRKEEEMRLLKEKLEAEDAEKRRLQEEKEAQRKTEQDAKQAAKLAKKEAIAFAMAAKKAEEDEAERLKLLELQKQREIKASKLEKIKDFIPQSINSRKSVAQDVFSSRERGSLWKPPPPPKIKKSERKPIVFFKSRLFGNSDSDSSSESGHSSKKEAETSDKNNFQAVWQHLEIHNAGDLSLISKTTWSLIAASKIMESSDNENLKGKIKSMFGHEWFPGLNGKETNLKNILQLAKKSLCEMGIRSREALRQEMIKLGMITDISKKNVDEEFLDTEFSKFHDSELQNFYDMNQFIKGWLMQVSKRKIPGCAADRPDSYHATLVKKGVLTKEDMEKLWRRNRPPTAPALESGTANLSIQLKMPRRMISRNPNMLYYHPRLFVSPVPSPTIYSHFLAFQILKDPQNGKVIQEALSKKLPKQKTI
ncbi:WD repeat-containing protein 87 [Physocladia obscura]|uniref:WD repeat-containing protein 87 n=1 Tax=Physocladia obscura TaxID=109957 RepID=A0AAD5SXR6_9FUNG|nr:WD repeat-containing protein 87 [Physocladia obscura]